MDARADRKGMAIAAGMAVVIVADGQAHGGAVGMAVICGQSPCNEGRSGAL